jgi:hypothetical protein
VDLAEFQTELALKRRRGPLGPAEKSAVAKEVLETISRCPDEIVKDEWLRRLAQRLAVDETSLRLQFAKRGHVRPLRSVAAVAGAVRKTELDGGEEDILTDVFMEPRLFESVRETDFASPSGRRIWRALAKLQPWPGDWSLRAREGLAPEDNSLVQRLLLGADELDRTGVEGRLRAMLTRRRAQQRCEDLRQTLIRDGKLGEAEQAEYFQLIRGLKGSPTK